MITYYDRGILMVENDTAPKTLVEEMALVQCCVINGDGERRQLCETPCGVCVDASRAAARVLLERMRDPIGGYFFAGKNNSPFRYELSTAEMNRVWNAMLTAFREEHGLSAEDERE